MEWRAQLAGHRLNPARIIRSRDRRSIYLGMNRFLPLLIHYSPRPLFLSITSLDYIARNPYFPKVNDTCKIVESGEFGWGELAREIRNGSKRRTSKFGGDSRFTRSIERRWYRFPWTTRIELHGGTGGDESSISFDAY